MSQDSGKRPNARMARSRMEAIFDIASGHLARIIERRLRTLGVEPRELPLTAAARVFGAMAVELAKWWLGRETPLSARDMDDRFHELVWHGLGEERARGGST